MKRIHVLAGAALCAMLAGCASMPDSHYYSLMPSVDTSASVHDVPPVSAALSPVQPGYAISVDAVSVPEQVDRSQVVLTDPDSTEVMPLNSYLWASTLSEELRAALADDLARRLHVIELPAKAIPDNLGYWKIGLRVQRFESLYGDRAVLEATWRLQPVRLAGRQAMVCRAQASVAVGEGMSSLIEGHQKALASMSGLIAAAIQGKSLASMNADASAQQGAETRILGCTQR